MSKNKNHPELKDDEMFLTNADSEGYKQIGWKTKRIGKIAYDIHGNPINPKNKMFPVFVQRKEYDNGMKEFHKIL